MLLARIYDVLPLLCKRCGGPMKIIAFVTDRESIRPILEHVGEPAEPPPIAPARGPPQTELALRGVARVDPEDEDQSQGLPDDHWA